MRDCCAALLEYRALPDPDPHVGVYVTSRDLWPTREVAVEQVRALAREFNAVELVQLLARIGFVLQETYATPNAPEEAEIIDRFLPPIWARKVTLWLEHGGRVKVVHRLAIPAAIQLVMVEAQADGPRHTVEGHESLIGQLLLHLNSILEIDYERSRVEGMRPEARRELIAAHTFCLGFFSELESIGPALARHWALVTRGLPQVAPRHPGEYFDFEGALQQRFGFSFRALTAVAMGLLTHYEAVLGSSERRGEHFLVARDFFRGAHAADVRASGPAIIGYLARTMPEHVARVREQLQANPDNFLQFFPLYERPLLQLENGAAFPLDMGYLTSAATEGSYWALFQRVLSEGGDAAVSPLRSGFGRAFEWYATELLRSAFPVVDGAPRTSWFDWDGDLPADYGGSLPDAVIVEGDTAFVVEVTSSGITPSIAASGDPGRLKKALEALWFGRGPRRESAKLQQLMNVIEALRSGSLALRDFHATAIRRYVPVLVTLRSLPRNRLLTQWYGELQRQGGCPESFTQELTILDAGELEELSRLAVEGISWVRLWDERRVSRYREETFHNFIYYCHNRVGLHPLLQEYVNDCFNSLSEMINGTRPFPERGVRSALDI